MGLPNSGLPSAREVADLAIGLIGSGVNVDGRLGLQCWDLPNYIFKKYWGFFTDGNAVDMQYYNYPRGFRFVRNTPDLIPEIGWITVWDRRIGPFGHTDIVIDGATKDYFYGIDQNWINANNYNGSTAAKIKHNYYGVVGFVVPPYRVDKPKPKTNPNPSSSPSPKETSNPTAQPQADPKPEIRDVTTVKYTKIDEDSDPAEQFEDILATGNVRNGSVKRIIIQNHVGMLSVRDLYKYKHTLNKDLLPHYYADRYNIWNCGDVNTDLLNRSNSIIVTICEDMNAPDGVFTRNELEALTLVKKLCDKYKLVFDAEHISVEKNAWRTYRLHSGIDITTVKDIKNANVKVVPKLLELLNNRDKIIHEKPKDIIERTQIKVTPHAYGGTVNTSTSSNAQNASSTTPSNTKPTSTEPTVVNATSSYTYEQALNKQMGVSPQVWSGGGFVNAGRSSVTEYMNPSNVWNNATRRYEMLDLSKYQGIPVDKLNQLLQGQGSLSGTGAYFAEAGKQHSVNEIYLIAHAIVESGHGQSNFASGTYGVYNFFGIAAYDNDPNQAINYARSHGWTTKEKGIVGGAQFVSAGYFKAGQQTLYRMRWNPKNPATHQYATAVNWASAQAEIIASYYNKIGLKGIHYIKDIYR